MEAVPYLRGMENIKITTVKLQTPTTYGEAYTEGHSYFVTYSKLGSEGTMTDLVTVLETRTTKTGRIAAKVENFGTGRVFWTNAKDPHTSCDHMHITEGMVTANWTYDGKR